MRPLHSVLAGVLVLLLASTTIACSGDDDNANRTGAARNVEIGDGAIRAPSHVSTGTVTFDVRAANSGGDPQIQLLALKNGAGIDELTTAMEGGDLSAVLDVADFAGGINLDPKQSTAFTVELAAGRYAFFDPDSGTTSSIMTAAGEPTDQRPTIDGTVSLGDLSIELPEGFGRGTYAVGTNDNSIHGLTLIQLNDNSTLEELKAMIAEDQDLPGLEVVRAGNLGRGVRQYLDLDLAAGRYLAASYFPDPNTGQLQAALGMIAEFTVDG